MEAVVMALVGFSVSCFLGLGWKQVIAPVIAGYFFAWVGHFFFEFNKPATFTYPAYSLISDFR